MWKKMENCGCVLAVMLFLTAFRESQCALVETEPRTLLTLPGQTVQVLCKVAIPLQYCRMIVPGYETVNLHPKATDVPPGGLRYFGAGLAAGQCGATITNIEDKNNGFIHCTMGSQSELQESVGKIQILVAKPPKAPELDVSRGSIGNQEYAAGEVVQATCYVRDGRPAANISWYLDEELLHEGLSEPITINSVDGQLQTIHQNMTRRLQPDDNSKQLRCVADHMALVGGRNSQSSVQLNVKYPPQPPAETPIDLFGYEIGKAGTISVELLANPRPLTQWTIDNVQIKEGTADPTGRFEVSSVEDMGRGRYKATLHISNIKKEDTETQFRLTAINDHGTADYYVVVSTSAEQTGVELGAGPIIGICISVLLVLLIIFLIVYARASGRWCFGERTARNPNYESDTESAHIEGQKKKRFDNLKSLFTKKSETTNSEPVTEGMEDDGDQETIPEEDVVEEVEGSKKDTGGIVYAELDLVKSNAGKPVVRKEDEKTEYAEIIYTKNNDTTKSTEDLTKSPK